MPKPTLVGLSYSPWTHRAQWALDHHGIGYNFENYLPVVGEPLLRVRAKKFTGKISVPILLTPHGAIDDSIKIARHADSIGKGSKLYDGHEAAVSKWTEIAEPALHAARGLVMRAIESNPLAQEESVSLPMPRVLKRPTARFGTFMLTRKWNARMPEADAEQRLVGALEQLREALNGRDYLDGEFSLADIVMAGVVQTVKPVDDKYIRLRPGTREAWTRSTLAARFGDLVGWRDVLFSKHHRRKRT
jgi:glutathione S-transferase